MGKKWPESAALRQVWPSTPRIARTLHAFLRFCQQCLIDLIVGKRLKSQSYHARTWISPSKNLQFLEVFPLEILGFRQAPSAPGPSQRDVQLPSMDPAAVERLPRRSRHRGDCPEAGRSGLRAIHWDELHGEASSWFMVLNVWIS